jgi:hypothetical protein
VEQLLEGRVDLLLYVSLGDAGFDEEIPIMPGRDRSGGDRIAGPGLLSRYEERKASEEDEEVSGRG